MKFIHTLLALLMIQVSLAQWEVIDGGNNFDGKFKYTGISGIGSDPNFDNPFIIVRSLPEYDSGILFLNNAGRIDDPEDLTIQFYFDDLEDVYTISDIIEIEGNPILKSYRDPESPDEKFSMYELIHLLKTYSSVTFRFKTSTSVNDIVFDLKGSSVAIKAVLPNLDELIENTIEIRRSEMAVRSKKQQKKDELLAEIKAAKLVDPGFYRTEEALDDLLHLGKWEDKPGDFVNIKYLAVVPEPDLNGYRFTGLVRVLIFTDESENNIRFVNDIFQIELDSPLWDRYHYDTDKDRLNIKFLYDFLPLIDLMEMIEDKVSQLEENSYPKWEISDIVDMKYTINKPFDDLVTDIKIRILLNNGIWISSTVVVTDLKISLDRLKEAGLEPLIEF